MMHSLVKKAKAAIRSNNNLFFIFKPLILLHSLTKDAFHLKKTVTTLFTYLFPAWKKNTFLDNEVFFRYIIQNRLSFIRWGDGETNIINGRGIGTKHILNPPKSGRTVQEVSPHLQKKMKSVLKYFSSNRSDTILFCVPYIFYKPIIINSNGYYNFIDLSFKKRQVFALTMYTLRKVISSQRVIGDALVFREAIVNKLKVDALWSNFDYLILIHNSIFVKERISDSFFGKVFFIKINSGNAFFEYEDTYNKVQVLIKQYNLNKKNTCMVICAGPMAKVLIFDLHKNLSNPPVCYDFGRYFEMERDL